MKISKIFAGIFSLALVAISIAFANASQGASLAILPFMASTGDGMTARQLSEYAHEHLSSFDGFEGENDFYTGIGDPMLDFGGDNRSFANVMDEGRIFIMTLTNTVTTANRTAYLIPGITWAPGRTANGFIADGTFNDVAGNAGLTAAGAPGTITDFLAFIKDNPTQVNAIRVESSNSLQIGQQIVIEELSPFRTLQNRLITLASFQDENTYRDKIVTVPTPGLILSGQCRMTLPIVYTASSNTTTTITFFCGAVTNQAQYLKNKMYQAQAGIINRGGLKAVRQAHQLADAANTKRLGA
jgi:hypothetical protein